MIILLRLLHIVSGGLWVGMAVFTAFYLGPALDDAGPAAGSVMPALARRGLATVLPALALVTVLSGGWLYWRVAGGDVGQYLASGPGAVFAVSAAIAIVAYVLGLSVTRPAMMRVAGIMQAAAALPPDQRAAHLAEAAQWKARGAWAGRVGGVLLILALAGMAVARYV